MKKFFKNKWVKRAIFLLIIIVLWILLSGGKSSVSPFRTEAVKRSDIDTRITGSGVISASESRTEVSKVNSTIKSIYYLEGDYVEAGTVIAELDSSDYNYSVINQRNSIRQAELSKENIERQIDSLKILAPVDGYINNITAVENTYAMANTQLCKVSAKNKYEITLQYTYRENQIITVGNQANVFLVDSLAYINGIVSAVGDRKIATSAGGQVIEVTITVENSLYALDNMKAKANISINGASVESVNQSTFKQVDETIIKVDTSGTIKTLYVKEGQYIRQGEVIAQLENPDLMLSYRTTAIALESAYIQLKQMEDKLEDYQVIAPISGTITSQDLKVGSSVSIGTVFTTISNRNELEFKIAVDELDIAKIDYEKEVFVTIDALPETANNPIKGRIKKMPLQGVSQGGVTDYYITIAIEGSNKIKISMTANADIIISNVKNVLCIPQEALIKENGSTYVDVVKDNPKVSTRKEIKIGASNTAYVEILEGLEEGELVVVPELGTGSGFIMGI